MLDSQPRLSSNLVVDQTSSNPAAVASAPLGVTTPPGQSIFIPNVAPDVGLSAPYNSWFTLFGQFFDHGVDQTVKSGSTVFVPLRDDDPLRTLGPDGKAGNGDEVPANQAFMVLTRAQNQPGPDGKLNDDPATAVDETADNIQDATNTDSPCALTSRNVCTPKPCIMR